MPDIFLDRDGVINNNRGDHVKCWDEFQFLSGSLAALVRLKNAGYRIFVITNQAIVNRGLLSRAELEVIHSQMLAEVGQAGGRIEAVLYCPHRPEEKCECRKPQPGLLRQAESQYGAQTAGSCLVSDHLNDIEAGEQVGCRTMLVLSGRTNTEYKLARPYLPVAPDLAAAVETILKTDRITYHV